MDWGSRPEQYGPYGHYTNYRSHTGVSERDMFDELKIGLASSDQVRSWSFGEVKKPETINYRTLKPEKEGLFDERIFGPQKDWECACGKYKRIRYRGILCEKCNVEVTRSKVRRERMAHIELAAPVTHIWFFKGVPSRLGYLLDMSPKELEKVIYFASYVITHLDEKKRLADLPQLEQRMGAELEMEREEFAEWRDARLERLEQEVMRMEEGGAKPQEITARRREVDREMKEREERADRECELIVEAFDTFRSLKTKKLVESEQLWRVLYYRYDAYFEGGMGAEAVRSLLSRLDLDAEMDMLRENLVAKSAQRRHRATQRIKVVKPFWEGKHSPKSMIVEAVPVIPPDLRPMVQLDGGRFATSDLNDLYRRVINRNNRLKRLLDLNAPAIIVNNEKRMLQEAVDALFDNGRRGKAVTGQGNRALKSLSDMLKGKQGRFRQNLLGKRVDYSGRSVIVVGPQLRLHQCGLPKVMALELFKPFVMKRLVDRDIAQNIKSAKRMVERQRPQVWDVLKEVIQEHPVLLNRAPTLHRLGIQAFEPILVEGKAIQIHPLVCEAFNADFDGDQMAVHLPLSAEAQAEARLLMLSTNNVLSPASGRPIVTPSQDMVIGIYYLSEKVPDAKGAGRAFTDLDEAMMAYDLGELALHAPIKLRLYDIAGDPKVHAELKDFIPHLITDEPVDANELIETTLGRTLLNRALPQDFPVLDAKVLKSDVRVLVAEIIERYDKNVVQRTLDEIKELGFEYSTRAGLTIGLDDVRTPRDKQRIIDGFQRQADKFDKQYQKGIITYDELRQELIEIWTEATEAVTASMRKSLSSGLFNPIDMMVTSGARGNMMQVRQIAGMRGLVANPKGDIIPRPIKSNFLEGLSVLEYFISTHGARKGLADTALRTADSGYLTRRLVDVAQEIIVHDEDSEDRGIVINSSRGRRQAGSLSAQPGLRKGTGRRCDGGRTPAGDQGRARSGGRRGDRSSCAGGPGGNLRGHQDPGALAAHRRDPSWHQPGLIRSQHGHREDGGARRGGRDNGCPVHRRAGYPADHADVPHRGGGRPGHHPRATARGRVVRGPRSQGQGPPLRGQRSDRRRGDRRRRSEDRDHVRRRGEDLRGLPASPPEGSHRARDHGRHAAHRGTPRPQGGVRDPGSEGLPALPGGTGTGGVPVAGSGHPRQTHRDDRPPDVAQGSRGTRQRLGIPTPPVGGPWRVPGREPAPGGRGQDARRRAPAAHGYHQGVAGHRFVVVGGFLPGDHQGAHRGGYQRSFRLPAGPEGERDNREADPGRNRGCPVPSDPA